MHLSNHRRNGEHYRYCLRDSETVILANVVLKTLESSPSVVVRVQVFTLDRVTLGLVQKTE